MKTILQEINAIENVIGSFVFNEYGQAIGAILPDIYQSQLPQIIESLLRSIAPHQAEQADWSLAELYISFSEGHLLIRNVEGCFMAALCHSSIKLPFLNVAFNVAAMKLKRMGQQGPRRTTANFSISNPMGSSGLMAGAAAKGYSSGNLRSFSSGNWDSSSSAQVGSVPLDAIGKDNIKKNHSLFGSIYGPSCKSDCEKESQTSWCFYSNYFCRSGTITDRSFGKRIG